MKFAVSGTVELADLKNKVMFIIYLNYFDTEINC